ncbi:MAG: futalosine hydrolase [Frankiaceae bacterium]
MTFDSHLLVITSVAEEAGAVLSGLAPVSSRPIRIGPYGASSISGGTGSVTVLAGGVGAAAAAAATATALALRPCAAVVNCGIGGAFPGQAPPCGIVVADLVVAADLGAQTEDGFEPLDALGFGPVSLAADPLLADTCLDRLAAAGLAARRGTILTVSTITGRPSRLAELMSRWGPVAEAMEGYGVLLAAAKAGIPAVEVRTMSNVVGHRDVAAWDMTGALHALSQASRAVFSSPLPGHSGA